MEAFAYIRLKPPSASVQPLFLARLRQNGRDIASNTGNLKSNYLSVASAVILIVACFLGSKYLGTLIATIGLLQYLIPPPLYYDSVIFQAVSGCRIVKATRTSNEADDKEPQGSERCKKRSPTVKEDKPFSGAVCVTHEGLGKEVQSPTVITCFAVAGSLKTTYVSVSLKGVKTDEELFERLRENYNASRRLTSWIPYLWSVHDIVFVKIRFSGETVTNMWRNSLPPKHRTEYDFSPRPARFIPPIGNNHLVYLFHSPDCADEESPLVLDAVPKLRYPGFADDVEQWGICILDRPKWPLIVLILMITSVLILLTIIAFLKGYCRLYIVFVVGGTSIFFVSILAGTLQNTLLHITSRTLLDIMTSCSEPVAQFASRLIVQCSLHHTRMILSLVLASSVPRLRQCFIFWQNVSYGNLFGFQAYSDTSCHCGFEFRGNLRSQKALLIAHKALQHDDLESCEGIQYPPLPVKVVSTDCISDDSNGNIRQAGHGATSASGSATAITSTPDGVHGPDSQSSSGQGSSDLSQNASSPGNGGGSGGNDGGNNSNAGSSYYSMGEYLHIILPDRSPGKRQVVVDIADLKTDYEVFLKLNATYREYRGSWRALTAVTNLRLTKYRLFTLTKVHTLFDANDLGQTMPDKEIVDYSYSYKPEDEGWEPPLIADDVLWHFFCHPSGSINDGVYDVECRNRFPKRVSPLTYTPNEGYPVGWGLEFVEKFNWKLFYHCESLIVVVAIVVPLLYGICSSDDDKVSTAFTIGQWLLGAGQILYIIILALSETLCFWRY